jgi:hypothetical protein
MNKKYENPFDPENQRVKPDPVMKDLSNIYKTNTSFKWVKS